MVKSNPQIVARLVVDSDGKPRGRSSGHYQIELSIDKAPEDTYSVMYELDDSYYDPLRESRDRDSRFKEYITSYGDYSVKATVRGRSDTVFTQRSLYDALYETHGADRRPAIQQALKDIREN
jgi:hypothetical protein